MWGNLPTCVILLFSYSSVKSSISQFSGYITSSNYSYTSYFLVIDIYGNLYKNISESCHSLFMNAIRFCILKYFHSKTLNFRSISSSHKERSLPIQHLHIHIQTHGIPFGALLFDLLFTILIYILARYSRTSSSPSPLPLSRGGSLRMYHRPALTCSASGNESSVSLDVGVVAVNQGE